MNGDLDVGSENCARWVNREVGEDERAGAHQRDRRGTKGKGVWAHACQLDLIQRTVFVVDRGSFHGIESGVDTINDFAEDGEPSVQMGLLGVCYEELGLVCICTRVGHGHHAAGVKLEARTKKGVRQNDENR